MDGASPARTVLSALPAMAGAGYREPHAGDFAGLTRPLAWIEVHAENYMVPGGSRLARLMAARERFPLSVHGVGLSLAGAGSLDPDHLHRLDELCRRTEPAAVSEHLAWSRNSSQYFNDLLPFPYTEESLDIVALHIDQTQDALRRVVLIENPSAYMTLAESRISEPDFLAELVRRTGCGLLVDVNNIHVSARNTGIDAEAYLDALPAGAIGEIHLAGHADLLIDGELVAFDDHGSAVREECWHLFRRLIARIGPRPTLIEWDNELPSLDQLLDEVDRAQREMSAEEVTRCA